MNKNGNVCLFIYLLLDAIKLEQLSFHIGPVGLSVNLKSIKYKPVGMCKFEILSILSKHLQTLSLKSLSVKTSSTV